MYSETSIQLAEAKKETTLQMGFPQNKFFWLEKRGDFVICLYVVLLTPGST